MLEGEVYAGGLTLNFFESAEFEAENPANSAENAVIIARNALRVLLMGVTENWGSLVSWRVIKAVLLSRDHELLRGMRMAFQQGFNHLFTTQLEGKEFSEHEFNQIQLYLANCMSLLPFSDMNPYESFKIPQWINGSWRMVDYKVTPIEMTPTKGFEKLIIDDKDRSFAYGLAPLFDEEAEPHLIFMGTTYPAGQSFGVEVNTDLEAVETAGKKLYRVGRPKITKWLDDQGKKVHVCGTSLGGSLSLLLAIDQPEKISRVDALNPPGLYAPRRKSRFDHWDECEDKPQVFIQKQNNDPVSKFGVWKKEWHILHVVPPAYLRALGALFDHALVYTGLAETEFKGVSTEVDNEDESRKARNFWIYTVLRSIAYLAHNLYRYLVLPVVRFALSHKLLIAAVVAIVLVNFLVPVFSPSTFFILASVPIALYLTYKLYQGLSTLLGWKEVKPAACHAPDLPRNEAMDIYSKKPENQVEEEFSYKEIREYYYARRVLLKQKPLIPENTVATEVGFSKYEVLHQSQDPAYEKERIIVRGSKAKIDDMKTTIRFLNRFGIYNEDQQEVMKKSLLEQNQAYTMGKVH